MTTYDDIAIVRAEHAAQEQLLRANLAICRRNMQTLRMYRPSIAQRVFWAFARRYL
ncbi:hypothetical protein [Tsukamurella strandjordii]|uniref:Uncharacterized protein n=1 Tax=Tsukamurella strandjordii TaxID=147577 RepID=A0AA90NHK6_9ACTN|nr:hypothetical protein [Tsukamurella strandjordii]MDP0398534.1 hypothetical protein [Tsukamurella strandjordii]